MSPKKSKPLPRRIAADTLEPSAPLGAVAARIALGAPVAAAPSPRVRAQLLARVRASLRTPPAGWRFESVAAGEGWRSAGFPGVRAKTLSVDEARDVVMLLLEIAPGARIPDHLHDDGADEGLVISGDVVTGGRLMRAGDYYHAGAGTPHTNTVSTGGCTALVSLTNRAWKKWRSFAEA
jgi:anti-sigma factor ChrR (cupin superfamily)